MGFCWPEENDMLLYVDDGGTEDTTSGNHTIVSRDLSTSTTELSVIEVGEVPTETAIDIEVIEEPAHLAPYPIVLGDSELETAVESPNVKKIYKCSKCKAIRKGHDCPFKFTATGVHHPADSTLTTSPSGSRAASNPENLKRLARTVEGDSTSDPNWSPQHVATRVSPRFKRSRHSAASESGAAVEPPRKRGPYQCTVCHKPKRGHICTKKNGIDHTSQHVHEIPKIVLHRVDEDTDP